MRSFAACLIATSLFNNPTGPEPAEVEFDLACVGAVAAFRRRRA